MTRLQLRSAIALMLAAGTPIALNASPGLTQGIAVTSTSALGPELSAQGHAEIEVSADVVHLTISVISTARSETAATQKNATRTATLIQAIKGLKIGELDIQTADYNVERQFKISGQTPGLIGYEVNNTVRITLHDLSRAGRLIDLATLSGATNITELTYGLNDRQAAEKKALTLAVADARGRAEAIAAAMNMTMGSLRSVNDSADSTFQSQSYDTTRFSGGGYPGGAGQATKISPQEITVTADVTVDYNLNAAP